MSRLRQPWDWWNRRPLRVRMTVGILALATVALVAAGAAAQHYLRNFLIDRVDQQIDQVAASLVSRGGPSVRVVPDGTLVAQYSGTQVIHTQISRLGDDPNNVTPYSPSASDSRALTSGRDAFTTQLSLGGYRLHTVSLGDGTSIVVGLPLSGVNRTTHQLLVLELVAFGSALLLMGVGAAWFVRRELKPLEQVAATARRVAALPLATGAVALDERVAVEAPETEVGQVSSAFNAMLGHVEGALEARAGSEQRLRRFIADASHELRTPLASIRGYAELFRQPSAAGHDRERAVARVESEAIRMSGLVDDLLLLARLDAAEADDAAARPLTREPVDMALLGADAAADLRAADPGRPVVLDLPAELLDGELTVAGDEARLRQVLANLTGNARTHTPPDTAVAVRVTRDGDDVVLGVQDDGPGVPEELQQHVFERFTRADASRTRDTGGSGLGLSIVDAIIRGHGGTVRLESEPGRTLVVVRLPAAGHADVDDSDVDDSAADHPARRGSDRPAGHVTMPHARQLGRGPRHRHRGAVCALVADADQHKGAVQVPFWPRNRAFVLVDLGPAAFIRGPCNSRVVPQRGRSHNAGVPKCAN
jgi:two-component system OmpR family sensor kinase